MDDLNLLSFGIETQSAQQAIKDIWTQLRELSARAITLKLEVDPDFAAAKAEVERLQKQLDNLVKGGKEAADGQEALAKRIEAAMKAVEKSSRGAGAAIREAFAKGGLAQAEQVIDDIAGTLSKAKPAGRAVRARAVVATLERVMGTYQESGFNNEAADSVRKAAQMLGQASRKKVRLERDAEELARIIRDPRSTDNERAHARNRYAGGQTGEGIRDKLKEADADIKVAKATLDAFKRQFGDVVDDYAGLFSTTNHELKARARKLMQYSMEQHGKGNTMKGDLAMRAAERLRPFIMQGPDSEYTAGQLLTRMRATLDPSHPLVGRMFRQRAGGLTGALGAGAPVDTSALRGQLGGAYAEVVRRMLGQAGGMLPQGMLAGMGLGGGGGGGGGGGFAGMGIDPEEIRKLLASLGNPGAQGGGFKLFLDQPFFIAQIKTAVEVAEKQIEMQLKMGAAALNRAVDAAAEQTARRRTTGDPRPLIGERGPRLTGPERERRRVTDRVEAAKRATDAAADPVGILRRMGIDPALLASVARGANRPGDNVDEFRSAITDFGRVVDEFERLFKGMMTDNKTRDLSSRALEEMRRQFFTPARQVVSEYERRTRLHGLTGVTGGERADERAAAAEEKRREYMRDVSERMIANQSAFREMYQPFRTVPLDPFKEDLAAYTRTYQEILKYNRELLAYTHARTQEEIRSSDRRISSARRSVELAQDELNIQLLLGRQMNGSGRVEMRTLSSQFRLGVDGALTNRPVLGQTREQMSLAEAYKRTAALLNTEFGPGLDNLNEATRRLRTSMLEEAYELERQATASTSPAETRRLMARAGRLTTDANGMGELTMSQYMDRMYRARGGRREDAHRAYAQTAPLSAEQQTMVDSWHRDMAPDDARTREEAFRMQITRERMRLLSEEVRMYRQLEQTVSEARRELEVLQRYDSLKSYRQGDPNGYRRAGQGLSRAFGGYALGMGVGFMAQSSIRQYMQYEQEIANIQAVLGSRSPQDAQAISEGVGETAGKYGADLMETAQAAKVLAQAGLNAAEVVRELDYTMLGVRGMGMSIDQMQELQVAMRAVYGKVDTKLPIAEQMEQVEKQSRVTLSVLERISKIEAAYAVSAQQLADGLKIAAPFLNELSDGMRGMQDVVDYSLAYTTTAVEQLRISGTQAGNALKFIGARILQPRILGKLQSEFGLKLAQEGGTELLPINEIMAEIHTRYTQLKEAGEGAKADRLLATVAGAHRVNVLAAIMQDYQGTLDKAMESSWAFAGAQDRAGIAMDTMQSTVGRLRTNFQLLFNNMSEGTGIADGLKAVLTGLANVMGGVGGQGMGTLGALGLIGAGFAGFRGSKKAYRALDTMREARNLGVDYSYLRNSLEQRRLSQTRAMIQDFGAPGPAAGRAPTRFARAGNFLAGLGGGRSMVSGIGRFMSDAGSTTGAMSRLGGAMSNFFGPTGTIVLGIMAAIAALGGGIKLIRKFMNDTDQYRIKLRDLESLRLRDSPQFNEYQDLAQSRGFQGADDAHMRTMDALVGDPNPNRRVNRSPEVQALLRQYGVSTIRELRAKVDTDGLDAGVVGGELIDAFINSGALGAAGTKLKEIENQEVRVAEAAKLIGLSAWAANHRIAESIEAVRASTSRMVQTTAAGMDAMDTRNRRGGWNRAVGAVGDILKNRETLQHQILVAPISSSEGQQQLRQGGGWQQLSRSRMGDFLSSSNMPTGLMDVFKGSGIITFHLERALNNMTEAAKDSARVADVLSAVADAMERSERTYDRNFNIRKDGQIQVQRQRVNANRAFEYDMAMAMLETSGMHDVVENIDPRAATREMGSEDRGLAWLNERLTRAAQLAQDQASAHAERTQSGAYEMRSAAELSSAMRHVALAMELGSEAAFALRKSLVDLFLDFYRQSKRMEQEEVFAHETGEAYNRNQSGMQLMKEFSVRLRTFEAEALTQIVSLQTERDLINRGMIARRRRNEEGEEEVTYHSLNEFTGADRTRADRTVANRRAQIDAQIGAYKEDLASLLSEATTLQSLFPTEEGRRIIRDLEQIHDDGFSGAQVLKEMSDRLVDIYKALQAQELLRRRTLQQSEQNVAWLERITDMEKARTETARTLTERMTMQEAAQGRLFSAKLLDLEIQRRTGELSQMDYQLKVQQLQAEYEMNTVMERRQQLQQAQLDLMTQMRENMDGMLEGVTKVLSDLDIWGQLARADGQEEFKEALGNLVNEALSPIGQTFYKRVVENFMGNVGDQLMANSGMQNLFATPEQRMRDSITQATAMMEQPIRMAHINGGVEAASNIGRAFDLGSTAVYESHVTGIVEGFRQARAEGTAPGGTPGAPKPGTPTPPGTPGAPVPPGGTGSMLNRDGSVNMNRAVAVGGVVVGAVQAAGAASNQQALMEAAAKQAGMRQKALMMTTTPVGMKKGGRQMDMKGQIGVMAGGIAGTMVGGGGAGAQTGSSLGSMVGFMAGGPIGAFAGGVIGGFLGGKLFGGGKQQPEVPQLQAIERAQRDTIAAIEQQTSQLLSPDNRIMNLPSTFNIPAYMPQFGSGGQSISVTNDVRVSVAVSGASMPDAEKMVERAVTKALEESRQKTARRIDRY